jgi:hypothetical protein
MRTTPMVTTDAAGGVARRLLDRNVSAVMSRTANTNGYGRTIR